MNKFSVGEVAILLDTTAGDDFIGCDVTIRSELTHRPERSTIIYCVNVYAYKVEYPNGKLWWHSPEVLKKKKPPEEASWDAEVFQKLNWDPTKELVNETA